MVNVKTFYFLKQRNIVEENNFFSIQIEKDPSRGILLKMFIWFTFSSNFFPSVSKSSSEITLEWEEVDARCSICGGESQCSLEVLTHFCLSFCAKESVIYQKLPKRYSVARIQNSPAHKTHRSLMSKTFVENETESCPCTRHPLLLKSFYGVKQLRLIHGVITYAFLGRISSLAELPIWATLPWSPWTGPSPTSSPKELHNYCRTFTM